MNDKATCENLLKVSNSADSFLEPPHQKFKSQDSRRIFKVESEVTNIEINDSVFKKEKDLDQKSIASQAVSSSQMSSMSNFLIRYG